MRRERGPFGANEGQITGGLYVLGRVFMFAQWGKIGIDHYRRGVAAEHPGVACDDFLVALVSAAFAMDSFVRDLEHSRPRRAVKRQVCPLGPKNDGHTAFLLLDQNYKLPVAKRDAWHDGLHQLFALRGDAVHYRGEPAPLYRAEDGTHYPSIVGIWTPQVAYDALRLVAEIMDWCLGHPRTGNEVLTDTITRHLGSRLTGFEDLPVTPPTVSDQG